MSKEQPEAEVTATDVQQAAPSAGQTYAQGAWGPVPLSAEEKAAQWRHTALHMAISIKPPGHTKAASVVEDAQAFEAYLKGEAK